MDLDDELRRLFTESGDELDVPVRADAEQVIVAGARRVRYRRIAAVTASGAAAVVAIVVGGIVLAGGAPDAMPPATSGQTTRTFAGSTTATPSISTTTPPTPSSNGGTLTETSEAPTDEADRTESVLLPPKLVFDILGPTGVGSIQLGQSAADARATGQLKIGDELVYPPCTAYRMVLDGREIAFVYVSLPESGNQVELLSSSELRTPEGAGPGWTAKQVAAVYPAFDGAAAEVNGYGQVAVPGNPTAAYQFWFEADGRMTGFNLRRADQPCDPT